AGRVPAEPAGTQDAAGMPVAQDRIDRFPGDQPRGGLLDRGALGRLVVLAVGLKSKRPLTTMRSAVAGEFLVLQLEPLGLVLGLVPGDAPQHAEVEAAARG